MAAMSVIALLIFFAANAVTRFCASIAWTITIDASIFIPLIVGSILFCAVLDWCTRKEKW